MKKKKDPAFLFYPRDFLAGVNVMNYTQRGRYITLLCIQHRKGTISEKDMLRISASDEKVVEKFIRRPNGRYCNPRLHEEMLKRRKFKKEQEKERFENSEKAASSLMAQGSSESITSQKKGLSSFSSSASFSSLNANGDKENINKEQIVNNSNTNITISYTSIDNTNDIGNTKNICSYETILNTSKKVIEFLNEKCKTHYRYYANYIFSLIADKLRDGFTEDDFITVIKNKASDWLNTEYARYLRPSTLFGDKFEEYLNKPQAQIPSTFDTDEFFQSALERSNKKMQERKENRKCPNGNS